MTHLAPEAIGEPGATRGGTGTSTRKGGGPAAAAAGRLRVWFSRRWVRALAEAVVSLAAALGYVLLSRHIVVNPIVRLGQVSGLAALQKYAAVLGLPLLALLLYTAYRGSARRHALAKRLVCAALAGLATGVIAGGVVVALRGTPHPLGGQDGDPGVLIDMANSFLHREGMSGIYPPAFPALMALWAKIRYHGRGETGFALHDLQIFFTAVAGPMAYLAWRTLLRPFWALLIAVPAAVLFLDPIRPYSHVVMIVLLPLLGYWLRHMRRPEGRTTRQLVLRGAGSGLVFGALFLWYSGWYVWAAPGIAVLAPFLFPWRRGGGAARKAGLFVGSTVAVAGVVASPLLYQMVRLGAENPDRYAFLSVYADPGYVLGWVSDRSGTLTYQTWPVAGEMAGQSGFALLLLFAVGLGLGLGLRSIMVRTAAAVLAGAWFARFWFASQMAHEKAVQLYPRTTWIIMYCLMILAVLGMMAAVGRGSGWIERTLRPRTAAAGGPAAGRVIPQRVVRQLAAGMICVTALFAAMGASWSVNRYMPSEDVDQMGIDAYRAHTLKERDGTCPRYSPVKGECEDIHKRDWKPAPIQDFIWCAGITADEWPSVCGHRAPKGVRSRTDIDRERMAQLAEAVRKAEAAEKAEAAKKAESAKK
ncbi:MULTISPECIES: hypothetical protein [Streptomyces]|uniref:hypothetical protein n=1 Tax=Streptomyces TaxID=1883 RepID=UPI00167C1824|nr:MULTISPECIES: hypothetical protein [Streptomyces]MBD3577175.1 hypothetical protein [Streptomyces sp. KD18]GGS86811.1 hypothetical protein GCM10010286_09370 [Streptomyces toxytricini]